MLKVEKSIGIKKWDEKDRKKNGEPGGGSKTITWILVKCDIQDVNVLRRTDFHERKLTNYSE